MQSCGACWMLLPLVQAVLRVGGIQMAGQAGRGWTLRVAVLGMRPPLTQGGCSCVVSGLLDLWVTAQTVVNRLMAAGQHVVLADQPLQLLVTSFVTMRTALPLLLPPPLLLLPPPPPLPLRLLLLVLLLLVTLRQVMADVSLQTREM